MHRLAAFGFVILALAGIAFGLVKCGRDVERAEIAVEDAQAQTGAAVAGAQTQAAVANQTDTFAARRVELTQEAFNGAREIQAHAGASQPVDAGLARLLVCRVGRVRGEPPPDCPAGDDRAYAEPPREPVLARPSS